MDPLTVVEEPGGPVPVTTQRGSTGSVKTAVSSSSSNSRMGPPSLSHSLTNTPVAADSPFPDLLRSSGQWSFGASNYAKLQQQQHLSVSIPEDNNNNTNISTAIKSQAEDVLSPASGSCLLKAPPVPGITVDTTTAIEAAKTSPRHPDIDVISSQAEQILLRAKHQLTVCY